MPDILVTALICTSLAFALCAASVALASACLTIKTDPLLDKLELSNRADDGAQAANAEIFGITSVARVDAAMTMLHRASARNQWSAGLMIIAVMLNIVAVALPRFAGP